MTLLHHLYRMTVPKGGLGGYFMGACEPVSCLLQVRREMETLIRYWVQGLQAERKERWPWAPSSYSWLKKTRSLNPGQKSPFWQAESQIAGERPNWDTEETAPPTQWREDNQVSSEAVWVNCVGVAVTSQLLWIWGLKGVQDTPQMVVQPLYLNFPICKMECLSPTELHLEVTTALVLSLTHTCDC